MLLMLLPFPSLAKGVPSNLGFDIPPSLNLKNHFISWFFPQLFYGLLVRSDTSIPLFQLLRLGKGVVI